jgi:multidrug efflux pump subunit AcrB
MAECAKRSTSKSRCWTWSSRRLLQDMIGDLTNSPEPIVIKLFSQDAAELLKKWAPKVGRRSRRSKGVVDMKNGIDNTISGPAMTLQVDPAVAARAGFTPQEVEAGRERDPAGRTGGDAGGDERPGLHHSRAVSREARASLDAIRNTLLTSSSTGKTATLGSLAKFD